ncbi:MAG: cysteine desulfurase family protein [Candidatus Xenobia bacterium]
MKTTSQAAAEGRTLIYLDHNATTPTAPEVVEAMLPYLSEKWGNASSGHLAGRQAKAGLEWARQQVARLIGAQPEDIVFTGGASEANNLCLKGAAWARRSNGVLGGHAVTTRVEHASVRQAFNFLEELEGWQTARVGVDGQGVVDVAALQDSLRSDTALVSVMLAQNEVGSIQPVAEVTQAVRRVSPKALMHTDASQAGGKIPVHVGELGVDMLVLAAHKFYGPKGVAAAWLRPGVTLVPLVAGVGHEGGRRAGTENVAGIVGMGRACELASERLEAWMKHCGGLRDRLWEKLHAALPEIRLNGHAERRLPNTLNVCFPGVDTTKLLGELADSVAASNGAACHWGVTEPSAVLTAMGVPRELALGAVRFSVGVANCEAEIDRAAVLVVEKVRQLQAVHPGSL